MLIKVIVLISLSFGLMGINIDTVLRRILPKF